ncbi:MAG TPA: hypothetical protein VFK14_00115 [Solirubrobacterales bacterium]|nr:hypothetical protein [Solirubrobacterales bacterium]
MASTTATQRRETARKRLKAMSHPLRAEALRLMRDRGTISPAAAARELCAEVDDVAYHVRKLVEYGCAELAGTRQVRGATEHFYRATEQHLLQLEEWEALAKDQPMAAEALVDEFMQHILDDYTASRGEQIVGRDEEFHITRTPLALDQEGLEEALTASEEHRERMASIAAKSAERRAQTGEEEIRTSSCVLFFKLPPQR